MFELSFVISSAIDFLKLLFDLAENIIKPHYGIGNGGNHSIYSWMNWLIMEIRIEFIYDYADGCEAREKWEYWVRHSEPRVSTIDAPKRKKNKTASNSQLVDSFASILLSSFFSIPNIKRLSRFLFSVCIYIFRIIYWKSKQFTTICTRNRCYSKRYN